MHIWVWCPDTDTWALAGPYPNTGVGMSIGDISFDAASLIVARKVHSRVIWVAVDCQVGKIKIPQHPWMSWFPAMERKQSKSNPLKEKWGLRLGLSRKQEQQQNFVARKPLKKLPVDTKGTATVQSRPLCTMWTIHALPHALRHGHSLMPCMLKAYMDYLYIS